MTVASFPFWAFPRSLLFTDFLFYRSLLFVDFPLWAFPRFLLFADFPFWAFPSSFPSKHLLLFAPQ